MNWLLIILLSALPVTEWRVTVPLAMLNYHYDPVTTFVLTLIGTMLPVVFIVYLLGPLTNFIKKKFPRLGQLIDRILSRIGRSKKGAFELLENFAPAVLAALPLPIIGGAYTSALASFLFGIPPLRALVYITIGSAAGIILMIFLVSTGRTALA